MSSIPPRPQTSVSSARPRPPTAPTTLAPGKGGSAGRPGTGGSGRPLSSSLGNRKQLATASAEFMSALLKGTEDLLPPKATSSHTVDTPSPATPPLSPRDGGRLDSSLLRMQPPKRDTVTQWPSSNVTPAQFRPSSGRSTPSTRAPSALGFTQPTPKPPPKAVPLPPSQHRTHSDQLLNILNPFLNSTTFESKEDREQALNVCSGVIKSVLSKSGLTASRRGTCPPSNSAAASSVSSAGCVSTMHLPLPMYVSQFDHLLNSAAREEIRLVTEVAGPSTIEESIPKHEYALEVLRHEEHQAWERVAQRRQQLQEVQRAMGLSQGMHLHAVRVDNGVGGAGDAPFGVGGGGSSSSSDEGPTDTEDTLLAANHLPATDTQLPTQGSSTGRSKGVTIVNQRRNEAAQTRHAAKIEAANRRRDEEDRRRNYQREMAANDAVYRGMLELHAQVMERQKRAKRLDRLRRRVRRGIIEAGAQFADSAPTSTSTAASTLLSTGADPSAFPSGASLPELRGRDSYDPQLTVSRAMLMATSAGEDSEIGLPDFLIEYYRHDTSTTHRLRTTDINDVLTEAGCTTLLTGKDPTVTQQGTVSSGTGGGSTLDTAITSSDREAVLVDRRQPKVDSKGRSAPGTRGRPIVLGAEAAAARVEGEPFIPGCAVDRDATGRVVGKPITTNMHQITVDGLMAGRRMLHGGRDEEGGAQAALQGLITKWKDVITDGTLAHFLYNHKPPCPPEMDTDAARATWQPEVDDFLDTTTSGEAADGSVAMDVADPFIRVKRMVAQCKADRSKIQRLQRQYDVLFARYETEKRSLLEHNRQYAEFVELKSFEKHLISEISRLNHRLDLSVITQKRARAMAESECVEALGEGVEKLNTLKQQLAEVETMKDHRGSVLLRIEEETARQGRLQENISTAQLKANTVRQRAAYRAKQLQGSFNLQYAKWLLEEDERGVDEPGSLKLQSTFTVTTRRKRPTALVQPQSINIARVAVPVDPIGGGCCATMAGTPHPVRSVLPSPSTLSLYFGSHSQFAGSYMRLVSRLFISAILGGSAGVPYGPVLRALLGCRPGCSNGPNPYARPTYRGASSVPPPFLNTANDINLFKDHRLAMTGRFPDEFLDLLALLAGQRSQQGSSGLVTLPFDVATGGGSSSLVSTIGSLATTRRKQRRQVVQQARSTITTLPKRTDSTMRRSTVNTGNSSMLSSDSLAGYAYWASIVQDQHTSPARVLFPLALHACARVTPALSALLQSQDALSRPSPLPPPSSLSHHDSSRGGAYNPPQHPTTHWDAVLAATSAMRQAAFEFHHPPTTDHGNTDTTNTTPPPTWGELQPILVASQLLDSATCSPSDGGDEAHTLPLLHQLCRTILCTPPPTISMGLMEGGGDAEEGTHPSASATEVIEHIFILLRQALCRSSASGHDSEDIIIAGGTVPSDEDDDAPHPGGPYRHTIPPHCLPTPTPITPDPHRHHHHHGGVDVTMEDQLYYHNLTMVVPKEGTKAADVSLLYGIPMPYIVDAHSIPLHTTTTTASMSPPKESDVLPALTAVCKAGGSVLRQLTHTDGGLVGDHVIHWMVSVLSPILHEGRGGGSGVGVGGPSLRHASRQLSVFGRGLRDRRPADTTSNTTHPFHLFMLKVHRVDAYIRSLVVGNHESSDVCPVFEPTVDCKHFLDLYTKGSLNDSNNKSPPTSDEARFNKKSLLWEWQREHVALSLLLWLRMRYQRDILIGTPTEGVPTPTHTYTQVVKLLSKRRPFHYQEGGDAEAPGISDSCDGAMGALEPVQPWHTNASPTSAPSQVHSLRQVLQGYLAPSLLATYNTLASSALLPKAGNLLYLWGRNSRQDGSSSQQLCSVAPQANAARMRIVEGLRKWMAQRADPRGGAVLVDASVCPSDVHWSMLVNGTRNSSSALTISATGAATTIRNAVVATDLTDTHETISERRVALSDVSLPPHLLACMAKELSNQLLLACPSLVGVDVSKGDGSLPVPTQSATPTALTTTSGGVCAVLPHPSIVPIFSTRQHHRTTSINAHHPPTIGGSSMYPLFVGPMLNVASSVSGKLRGVTTGAMGRSEEAPPPMGDPTLSTYLSAAASHISSKVPYSGVHTVFGETALCSPAAAKEDDTVRGALLPDLYTCGGGFSSTLGPNGVVGPLGLVYPPKMWLSLPVATGRSHSPPRTTTANDISGTSSPRMSKALRRQLQYLWGEGTSMDSLFLPTGTAFIPPSVFGAELTHRIHERSFRHLSCSLMMGVPSPSSATTPQPPPQQPLLSIHRDISKGSCVAAMTGNTSMGALVAAILALIRHADTCITPNTPLAATTPSLHTHPTTASSDTSLTDMCVADAHRISSENEEMECLLEMWGFILQHESNEREYSQTLPTKSVGDLSQRIQSHATRNHFSIASPRTLKDLIRVRTSSSFSGINQEEAAFASLLQMRLEPLMAAHTATTTIPDRLVRDAFIDGYRLYRAWRGVCITGASYAVGPRGFGASGGMMLGRPDSHAEMQWESLGAGPAVNPPTSVVSIRSGTAPLSERLLVSPIAFLTTDIMPCVVPQSIIQVEQARGAKSIPHRGGGRTTTAVAPPKKKPTVGGDSRWLVAEALYRATGPVDEPPVHSRGGVNSQLLRQIARNIHAASNSKSKVVTPTPSNHAPTTGPDSVLYDVLAGYVPHLLEDGHSWGRHVEKQAQALAIRIVRGGKDRAPSSTSRRGSIKRKSSGKRNSSGGRRRSSSGAGRRKSSGSGRRRSSQRVEETAPAADPDAVRAEAEERAKVEELFGPLSQWETVDSVNSIPYQLSAELRFANIAQTGIRTSDEVGRRCAELVFRRRMARRAIVSKLPANHSAHKCRDAWDAIRRSAHLTKFEAEAAQQLNNTDHQHPLTGKMSSHNISHSDMHSGTVPVLVSSRLPSDLLVVPFKPTFTDIHDEPPSQGSNERLVNVKSRIASHRHFGKSYSGFGGRADSSIATPTAAPRLLPTYVIDTSVGYARRIGALTSHPVVVNASSRHALFTTSTQETMHADEQHQVGAAASMSCLIARPVASPRRTTTMGRAGLSHGHHHSSGPSPLPTVVLEDAHKSLALSEFTGFDTAKLPTKPPKRRAASPLAVTQSAQPTYALLKALVGVSSTNTASRRAVSPTTPPSSKAESRAVSPSVPAGVEVGLLQVPNRSGLAPIIPPVDSLNVTTEVSEPTSPTGSVTTTQSKQITPTTVTTRRSEEPLQLLRSLHAAASGNPNAAVTSHCLLLGRSRRVAAASPLDTLRRVAFRVVRCQSLPMGLLEEAATCLATITGGLSSSPSSTRGGGADLDYKHIVRDLHAISVGSRHAHTTLDTLAVKSQAVPHSSIPPLQSALATKSAATMMRIFTGATCRHNSTTRLGGDGVGKYGLALSLKTARHCLDALRFAFTTNTTANGSNHHHSAHLAQSGRQLWLSMNRAYQSAVLFQEGVLPYISYTHSTLPHPPPTTTPSTLSSALSTSSPHQRPDRVKLLVEVLGALADQQDALLGFLLDTVVSEGLIEINKRECTSRVSWIEEGCAKMTQYTGGGHLPELATALSFIRCGFNATSGATILQGMRAGTASNTNNADAVSNRWLVHSPPIVKSGVDGGLNPSVVTASDQQAAADTALAKRPALFVTSVKTPGRTFIRRTVLQALLTSGVAPNQSSKGGLGVSTPTTPRHLGRSYSSVSGSNTGVFSLDDVFARHDMKVSGAATAAPSKKTTPLYPSSTLQSKVATIHGVQLNSPPEVLGVSLWGSRVAGGTGGGFHRSVLGSSPAMSPKGGSLVQLVTPIANNMSNIYANDALHGSRVRGGASGIREQLPEEVRYMQAQRHKLRTALTQSTESSPPSSTSSYTSSSAVNHLLSCTLVLTTLTGEPTVHTPPLFDSTSKDFAELISTYVKLRAIADNREAVGSLLRQRRVRTARRKAARTMQVSESTPSFALVDPSVETTALPWWATGNAINGPRGSVTQSSDAAGCRISTPLPTVIGLSGIEDANKHSTASKWLQVPPSLLPQPTLSSTASSGANLGGGGGTNNNDTTDLTPRGTPQWGAGGRDPLDYSFASVEGSEHIKSDGSISNHNNSPGASMSVDGGQSTSVQGGGLDSSSRSATPTPRTSIGKSGGGSLTPRSPGGTSISGARKMSRQGRKAVRGKSKATSAAQREQLTKSMWNAFQRRVVGSLETESLEASTGVHLAAFATFLANGITPNFTVLNAIAKGTSIPPSHLQLPPTTTSTAAQSTLGMGGGGSTIGLSRSASTAHSGRFSRSHVKSTSATSMKLTSQEKDFRLVSTSFDGPLPLSCHATAAPQQAMLWDCLRAQPDHPLRRADILIHNTAYPYRHRLSARYASLFLLEHSRRASGTLEASLYGLLCKRERDEKQRRSQEGTDVHDSQRGFGTLRSTFTTFGAYLEEFGEDDNPFSSGRHAIAMSTTDEEASPRLGGAHRSMKSASSFHSKEASPVDTFTPSQQQGYWLSRLSLGDERFAVGSVPMCSSSRARGPRYAKWDAEKLVAALGSVCTPYSAQDESRPTPPPSVGSARCQSTVLRAVYGEHPVHPSNEASILVDELDNVSNCDVSDDDAGSCVSSTTAFSSESEEEQGGIVQDFSAFPEPLQGADDADGTTISSDTSTSGSSYVYYSEGEPDYEEEAEEGSPSEDGGFMDGGAFGDEREGSLNHPSSDSSSSSRSDSSTTSTFVPTVKRDPESATSLEQLEKGEHAYLAGLRRTRKATLDAHRKVTRNKTKTLRDKLRVRRAGVSGGASGIKPVKKATPEGKCNNTNAAPKKKSAFTPLAQPTFTHRTAFGQSLSHRILGQIKFARSALCLRLLAHDVLVLSANREEKSIAKLIALRGGGADTANYAKPSDRATDAIAAAALTSARSRAFAPGTAADSNQGDASVKGPRDGPATSIVDGLDYYTDHPAVASSGTAASDVAAYPPELNAELLLCKLPTVNDLSRVLLNNTQPKPHPPKTATTTTPPSNVDDELWDVDDFIEALQQVVLSRYIVSAHH